MQKQGRIFFLDHLRGFMFALMAFDHCIHAYAQELGQFWFYKDYDRQVFWNYVYLFNQAIIMPMIFFIVGHFVLGAFKRHGLGKYMRNRLMRYAVPFVLGIPLIVPLLSYPRYHDTIDSSVDLLTFWRDIFFQERFQAGPFWVMQALFVGTILTLLLYKLFPALFKRVGDALSKASPLFIGGFTLFAIVTYTISDWMWGGFWWVSFNPLIAYQGSKFIMNFTFFFLGAAAYEGGVFTNTQWLTQLKSKLPQLTIVMLLLGLFYVIYSVNYMDQAFTDLPYRARMDSSLRFADVLHIIDVHALGVIPRTTALALLVMVQMLFLLALFAKRFDKPTPLWTSLALNGYGIFILHEVMVVWLQYVGMNFEVSSFVKPLIIFTIAFPAAWGISNLFTQKFCNKS